MSKLLQPIFRGLKRRLETNILEDDLALPADGEGEAFSNILMCYIFIIEGAAVYDSLLNVSQEGAGFNTQMAMAMSLSEVKKVKRSNSVKVFIPDARCSQRAVRNSHQAENWS